MSRILIVEDDDEVVRVIQKALSPLGLQIDHAPNGKEALELFGQNEYALIVMDLVMPERSGTDILKTLHMLQSRVPVLVCSAFITPDVRKELECYDRIEFMGKPFRPELLAAIARKLLTSTVNP